MILAPVPSHAQTAKQYAVSNRAPVFQSEGLELGRMLSPIVNRETAETLNSFRVRAGLGIQEEFDDNIFNTPDNGTADKVFHIMPSASLESDWSRHSLNLGFEMDRGYYEENTQENYNDYIISAKGRVDIQDQSSVALAYAHTRQHEIGNAPLVVPTAFSPTNPFGQVVDTGFGTTVYHQDLFNVKPTFSTDPLIAWVDLAAQRWSYANKNGADLGFQNFWEYSIIPRIGYQTFEDTSLFIQPSYAQRIYDSEQNLNGFNDNSQEYQFLVGLTYDFTDLTYIEAGVGVVHSTFTDPAFKPTTGPAFDISGIWNATEFLTLSARALQSNLATTDFETKQVATNFFSLGADWEARDNLIVSLLGSYTDAVYEESELTASGFGAPIQRHDRTFGLSVGAKYMFTDYFTASVSYLLNDRKSNIEQGKLTKRQWFLTLAAKI